MNGLAWQLQSVETKGGSVISMQFGLRMHSSFIKYSFCSIWRLALICVSFLNYMFTLAAPRRGCTTPSTDFWACGPQGKRKWFSKCVLLCLCCSLGQYLFGGLSVKCQGSNGPFLNKDFLSFFFFKFNQPCLEFYRTTLHRSDNSLCKMSEQKR